MGATQTMLTAPINNRSFVALPPSSEARLDELFREIEHAYETFVGYPCSGDMDYSPLFRFLQFPINNVGDPFDESTYRVNTKQFEREVIQWFGKITHAPEDSYWGYVTNGGSEGNLFGIYLARELYPEGIVYYSEQTHYSVSKNLRVLKMPSIMLRSLPSGEIDYDDFQESVRIHRELPPIVFANIGTTMKQAVDDVGRIRQILRSMAVPRSYIHCDAALGGMVLPFVEDAPEWDFRAGIDSLSISGHKLIGSPVPSGVVLARKAHVTRISRLIEYVGTLDTTLTGSRNGITPLFLWYAIQIHGEQGFRDKVARCLEMAEYVIERLNAIGVRAWRNNFSMTVVFPRPPQSILSKWQIAVEGDDAHLITMPHVTREQIDRFVIDLDDALQVETA